MAAACSGVYVLWGESSGDPWHVARAQVTAYQVIQNAGATGKMPTSVQFKITDSGGDQSVSVRARVAPL